MNRHHLVLAAFAIGASAPVAAQSRAYDPKALARYDISFVRCEKLHPELKGHRDEAYLSLWRAKPNEKTNARLAEARASAAYKAERGVALGAGAKASSAPDAQTFERECSALWGEWKRAAK